MTSTPTDSAAPIRELDHHDCPGLTADPFAAFGRFRGDRIFWSPRHGGFWVLTHYDDIRTVLSDPRTFSNRTGSIPPAGWPRPLIPEELDPPDHGKYRALIARRLAGTTTAVITAAIERECVELTERLAPLGACDLVADYSRPLQRILFTTLFAVPHDDATTCAGWIADLLQNHNPARRQRAVRTLNGYLIARIAERAAQRAAPSDAGLLGQLADAQLDGQSLDDDEVLDIAFLMVMASLGTLANSLNFSFRYLAQHPDRQQLLATDPSTCARAAEELLRLHSVVNVARTATRDTTVAGIHIASGDRLLLCLSMAGRDPAIYPDPDTADFNRPTTPAHLAYGAGPHRCLGARIASHALTAALREWHHRIPAYTIPADAEIRTGGGAVCSVDALPLTWPI